MAFDVQISTAAEDDIQSASDYIATNSPEAAARWQVALWDLIFSLRDMPLRFAIIRESDELGFQYRSA